MPAIENASSTNRSKATFLYLCGFFACIPWGHLGAAELYSGHGTTFRWDNTVRYSTMFRVEPRDAALILDPNEDDGDRNFRPGLASNRLDLLSQADLDYGDFGLRLSAAAWYDSVYHQRNDNDSARTFNPASASPAP